MFGLLASLPLNIAISLNIAQQVMKVMVNDYFGLLKKLGEILNKLKSRGFLASSLSTYDLSTFFTTLPHTYGSVYTPPLAT